MTLQVHQVPEPDGDDIDRVQVLTVDAAKRERWYEVTLTSDDTFGDGYLMAGKQLSGPNGDGLGVPSRVYDVARQYFRDEGYEVHES